MSVSVFIKDADGKGVTAKVTEYGELVVGAISYDLSIFVKCEEDDIAYNLFEPSENQVFIVTGLRIKANRSVSPTEDADVFVFTADAIDSATVISVIHREAMVKGESVSLFPLNVLVPEGVWINAKTSDDDVYVTVTGHYLDKVG